MYATDGLKTVVRQLDSVRVAVNLVVFVNGLVQYIVTVPCVSVRSSVIVFIFIQWSASESAQ
jgi:hypothetical protein